MASDAYPRRGFLAKAAAMTGGLIMTSRFAEPRRTVGATRLHVACNSYTWQTFYARENRSFNASLDVGLGDVAQSGLDGFEPSINSPGDIDMLVPLLKKHRLEMRSL